MKKWFYNSFLYIVYTPAPCPQNSNRFSFKRTLKIKERKKINIEYTLRKKRVDNSCFFVFCCRFCFASFAFVFTPALLCGYFVNWNDKLTAVTATTTTTTINTIILTIEVVGGNQRETIEKYNKNRGKFSTFFVWVAQKYKIKKTVQIFDSQSWP